MMEPKIKAIDVTELLKECDRTSEKAKAHMESAQEAASQVKKLIDQIDKELEKWPSV